MAEAPMTVPEGFDETPLAELTIALPHDRQRSVRFLGVLPIYEDEMLFKLDKGADALYTLLDEHEVTDLVDVDRPSVVPKKRRYLGRQ
jgi:hypothetical protein